MSVERKLVEPATFALLGASRDFIAAHFDQKIQLAQAADHACLSPFHYQRMFQRAFGETPHEFQTRMRVEAAQQMLRKSQMSVTEICVEVGYESLGSFSDRFQREVGVRPVDYRRVFSVPGLWELKSVPRCFRFPA